MSRSGPGDEGVRPRPPPRANGPRRTGPVPPHSPLFLATATAAQNCGRGGPLLPRPGPAAARRFLRQRREDARRRDGVAQPAATMSAPSRGDEGPNRGPGRRRGPRAAPPLRAAGIRGAVAPCRSPPEIPAGAAPPRGGRGRGESAARSARGRVRPRRRGARGAAKDQGGRKPQTRGGATRDAATSPPPASCAAGVGPPQGRAAGASPRSCRAAKCFSWKRKGRRQAGSGKRSAVARSCLSSQQICARNRSFFSYRASAANGPGPFQNRHKEASAPSSDSVPAGPTYAHHPVERKSGGRWAYVVAVLYPWLIWEPAVVPQTTGLPPSPRVRELPRAPYPAAGGVLALAELSSHPDHARDSGGRAPAARRQGQREHRERWARAAREVARGAPHCPGGGARPAGRPSGAQGREGTASCRRCAGRRARCLPPASCSPPEGKPPAPRGSTRP